MLGILLAVFAEGGGAYAQVDSALGGDSSDAPQPESRTATPTIRASTHLVVLDVVVTGAHGRTVPDLTKDEFHLFEDGEEQTVKIFEEHEPVDPGLLAERKAAIAARLPSNTFTNYEPLSGDAATVLLLNELLPLGDYDWEALRAQMLNTVVSAPKGTPFMLFELDNQLRLVQGMTANRERLITAVNGLWDKVHFAPLMPITTPLVLRRRETLTGSMQQLGDYLTSMPGKKTLFTYTGGLAGSLALPPPANDLHTYLCSVMDVAEQGRISIYRIYPSGNVVYGFGCAPQNTSLKDVYDTGSHYYTLYYTPTNGDWNGSYRKFKVVLNDKRLHANYRPGYYGRQENASAMQTSAAEPDLPQVGLPVPSAMGMGSGPLAPVVFTVSISPSDTLTGDGAVEYRDFKVTYAIAASELKLTQELNPGGGSPPSAKATVEVLALLYDGARLVNTEKKQVFVTFNGPADPRIQTAGVTADLNLRIREKGLTSIRFFLRDAIADRSGEIDVPINKIVLSQKVP